MAIGFAIGFAECQRLIAEEGHMCVGEYNPKKAFEYVINTYPLRMRGVHIRWRHELPEIPAIYFVVSELTGLLYIGKANCLKERWQSHHRFDQLSKYHEVRINWITFPNITSDQLMALEREYIEYFMPVLNQTPVPKINAVKRSLKQGKSTIQRLLKYPAKD
jgi:predicted GIY-YIG superfamily endonuclease